MKILGIDPGSKGTHGFAVLDVSSRKPRACTMGRGDIAKIFEVAVQHEVSLVVVECPVALHRVEANVPVMATAWSGGWAGGFLCAKGLDVLPVNPSQWRASLIGTSRAGDDQDARVKLVLEAILADLPSRTNTHSRDAAGVAIVGWRMRQMGAA